MINPNTRIRKSEKLTDQERKIFKKWVDNCPTKIDACEALGFTRPRLDRLLYKGSGKPDAIKAIREVLQAEAVKA